MSRHTGGMRKRAALVAVWVIGTLASIALAWTAVAAVGGQVTDQSAGRLSAVEVADAAAAEAAPTAPPTSGTGAAPPQATASRSESSAAVPPAAASDAPPITVPPASPPTSSRTFESAGGSVGVRCSGSSVSLDFATPRAGYATEVHDPGPAKVEVRFERDDGESRIIVRCSEGTLDAEVRGG